MKSLLFASNIAAAIYAASRWDFYLYGMLWLFATGGVYAIYRSIYHYFFTDP